MGHFYRDGDKPPDSLPEMLWGKVAVPLDHG